MGAFNITLELLLIPGAYHTDTHYFLLMHLSILNVSVLPGYMPTGISLFEKNLVEIPAVLAVEMHH